jgi:hypothetical protein
MRKARPFGALFRHQRYRNESKVASHGNAIFDGQIRRSERTMNTANGH